MLMAEQKRLRRLGGWVTGPSSLMAVLGLRHDEVHNCRVVAWLLDPLARHGLGVRIFTSFVHDVLPTEKIDVTTVRPALEVSRTESRADIVFAGLEPTVVIEAKINAGEGELQGARLERDWPDATLVFLTRQGIAVPGTARDPARWRPYSWYRLAYHAESALQSRSSDSVGERESRLAVAEWIRHVKEALR